MIAQVEREVKPGCPLRDEGQLLGDLLSPGLELDVLDGDVVKGEFEVMDGAHDGGVEAVGEDLGGERVWEPSGQVRCQRGCRSVRDAVQYARKQAERLTRLDHIPQ